MLKEISWSEFIWFLVYVLVPYYLIVLVLYFRNEILAFGRGQQHVQRSISKSTTSQAVPNGHTTQGDDATSNSETPFTLVHELLEDLKKLFTQAARSNMIKEELIQAIHSKLKAYPKISATDLREDIDQHIFMEVKQVCGIELEPENLLRIWPD